MLIRTLILLCFGASLVRAQAPGTPDATEAVRRASLDYLEGFYEGDTSKTIRALHPELSKLGFSRDTAGTWNSGSRMTYAQAIDFARRVKARNTPPNPAWPKEVKVMEVLERTAVAKVTAWWGSDYLLLGLFNGEWKILQVIWESPPRRGARRERGQP